MKKVIVTTTIQHPTEAIHKFDQMSDWTLIVAGDLKTPKDYKLKNGIYLSPEDQEKRHRELSDAIGWNNHGRRNFGNLWAKDLEADIVAIVDDDNIPLENWGDNLLVNTTCEVDFYNTDIEAFDPIGATNYPHLWHRGFPIQLVKKRSYGDKVRKKIFVDIQADFWNGDPDIDAIERMLFGHECTFLASTFPFASCKPSPFNSQNIFISKKVLSHYFVLPHVSPLGRMGDIWISYHMCSLNYQVVYNKPSVYQKRNAHDLTEDMVDEFIGYQKNFDIVKSISERVYQKEHFWPSETLRAYKIYQEIFA